MIPDEVVEQVQAAADIVAIISEHVRLKKVGSVYRGPCPFHQGTNANFSVVPRGGYYCFVCHEKGSVFTFVQKRLGLSFVEAVKYVGEKSGVEVREVQRAREGPDPREPLWETMATAAGWFKSMLWEHDLGRAAREYLAGRAITREVAEKFGIGFAPHEIGLLRGYLNGIGYTDERLLEVGLLVKREDLEEPRPRFRDRLIFPILDAGGHTVGFGGRLLGQGEPKYLNSAENAIYSKGRLLYNFHSARHAIRRAERVVLVEGYVDVVRLVSAGFEETVAPLGTALTDDQADLIARSAPTVFLLYDADAPGQKASFRAADVLLARGLTVRMVTLPDGDDPDTFVATQGGAALEKQLGLALDVFDRKVQLLERGGWFSDLQRKRRALDRLIPTIRSTTDPITRDLYLARAAQAAGVDRSVLVRELELSPRVGRTRPAPRVERGTTPPDERRAMRPSVPESAPPVSEHVAGASSAERELVRAMLCYPESVERIVEEVARIDDAAGGVPEFEGPGGGGALHAVRDPIYTELFREIAAAPEADATDLAERLSPIAVAVAEELRAEPMPQDQGEQTVADSLRRLQARMLDERVEEQAGMVRIASSEQDKDELLRRGATLQREAMAVGTRRWGRFVPPAGR